MIWGFSCHCSLPKRGENTIFVIPLSQAERLRGQRDVNLTEVAQQDGICCFFLGCPSFLMMNLLQTADRQACQKVAKCESVKKAKDDGDEGLGMHSMLPLINWKSMET